MGWESDPTPKMYSTSKQVYYLVLIETSTYGQIPRSVLVATLILISAQQRLNCTVHTITEKRFMVFIKNRIRVVSMGRVTSRVNQTLTLTQYLNFKTRQAHEADLGDFTIGSRSLN